MITLSILVYIIISFMIAGRLSHDHYTITGRLIKAKKFIPALLEGFLTLPTMALIAVAASAIIYYGFKFFIGTISWIFYNMP